MTTYAMMGEVQQPDMPATRHVVADTIPGGWGVSICSAKQRVWVHVVAGVAIPFPGPLGAEMACAECTSVVETAQPGSAEQLPREKRRWQTLFWRRDESS